MKALTKKQKQWIWFVGLWCAGLGTVYLMSGIIRLLMF